MKVLYDHQIFSLQIIGGISRYIHELSIRNKESRISVLYSENLYLKKNKKTKDYKGKNRLIYTINKFYSKYLIKKNKFDLLHITYYDNYFLEIKNKNKFIVTVHDMIHEIYKGIYFHEQDDTIKLKKEICEKADGIIAISNKTKDDLIRILNINPEKIKVIYHGSNLEKKEKNIELPKKYILFVGSRVGYKNFFIFLQAVSEILKKDKDLKLLCVGKSFSDEELTWLEDLQIENKVQQKLALENEMYTIYKNAECFVFPSLYEGFGIPILEAFEADCPVVLSSTSCFPEIAEDAGKYFNPTNKEEIKNAIKEVIYNIEEKEELIRKGKQRLKDFSWDKTYIETLEFYKKILKK